MLRANMLLLALGVAGCAVSHERVAATASPPGDVRTRGDAGPLVTDPSLMGDAGPLVADPALRDAGRPSVATECVAGARRWCNDAVYDGWGMQYCGGAGTWGPCREPTVTASGITDRPATECGCRYFYFHPDCCEDQLDRDGDGNADCLVPADWVAPACETDGSPCSYCDVHGDCGGPDDFCLFARDGYTFCARDCTDTPCTDGYRCLEIGVPGGVIHQCVPQSETCG